MKNWTNLKKKKLSEKAVCILGRSTSGHLGKKKKRKKKKRKARCGPSTGFLLLFPDPYDKIK